MVVIMNCQSCESENCTEICGDCGSYQPLTENDHWDRIFEKVGRGILDSLKPRTDQEWFDSRIKLLDDGGFPKITE